MSDDLLTPAISIHAPLAGSDRPSRPRQSGTRYFNPRSPCGERHHHNSPCRRAIRISIHAPLAGSDPITCPIRLAAWYFNPRSPCGERPAPSPMFVVSVSFQSTLPLRGATIVGGFRPHLGKISIHAPLAGSDIPDGAVVRVELISIHAPLAGSDASVG